jgi:transposase
MFIRKTKKVVRETQKAYFVYQLVESVRTERGPRQQILLSLGSDIGVADEDLKPLANRIEEIFTGVQSFATCSEKIEYLAERYASQLLQRISDTSPLKSEPIEEESDYQSVDIQTIEQQDPKTVGAEHLLLHLVSQVGLQSKLKELGFSKEEIALSLGTIIGRAIFPASERATYEWLIHRSGLGELIDFDFRKTSLYQLYKISDLLLKHKAELEKYLTTTEQAVLGYKSTMILYDMTNTYMEGQAKNNLKAKRGFSKEKRFDCPLITLGLVINEHGFATRSSFFPGNISEPKTLEQAVSALHSDDDLLKPVIILDAGIATEENLQWLRINHFSYIVSARQNAPSMELEGSLVDVGGSEKARVKAALIKSDDLEERWLYCESEAKEAVASQIKAAFCKRFETDLQKLSDGLTKPKCRKQYGKILERVGRLKEKHSRVSGCYEIAVTASSDNQTAIAIQWTLKPEKLKDKLNGHYFLRTNLNGVSAEPLWNLYNSIRVVEDAFRFMKSALGMRPVYHQKEHRVDGHLWITILAYHLIRSCLYQLNKQGIFYHWPTIRNRMSSRIRITMRAKTQEGKTLYHRSTTRAEALQKEIYQAFSLNSQILKAKKTLV